MIPKLTPLAGFRAIYSNLMGEMLETAKRVWIVLDPDVIWEGFHQGRQP